jgi:ribonuclease R
VKFNLSESGDILSVQPHKTGLSERIIEIFMIEANEAAAETLSSCSSVGIFRNHPEPEYKKVRQWAKSANFLGLDIGALPKKASNKTFQRWFDIVEDHRLSYQLKSSLVRSMQKALYEGVKGSHFGLASSGYTHFTSPIRRYPDLYVHRLLKKHLFNNSEVVRLDRTEAAARRSSSTERAADDAERDVQHFKKLIFLSKTPEKEYSAFVSNAGEPAMVFLFDLLMQGILELPPKFGDRTLKLGDEVKVIWLRNDMDRLDAYFSLLHAVDGSGSSTRIKRRKGYPRYRREKLFKTRKRR